jgi:class 3 adenylate cyclase
MKYTSVGDVVNTAARLESFVEPEARSDDAPPGPAEAGRILIGEETRRRIGSRFAVRDLGEHRLKGKADPVRVYRLLGERESEGKLARSASGEQEDGT